MVSFSRLSGLFAAIALLVPSVAAVTPPGFNPFDYQKKFVSCPAVDRSGATPKDINLRLAYIDINPEAKKTIIMVHGWPGMWTSFRNQIEAFKSEYRIITFDLRGYGDSQHPDDLFFSNSLPDFVNDILCILEHAGVSHGICMGHDFGAQTCWEAGRMRPDVFFAIFNAVVPYISSSLGFLPDAELVQLVPTLGYNVYFSTNATGAAAELNANPRDSIRSCAQLANDTIPSTFLLSETNFLEPWNEFVEENNLTEIPFSGIMSHQVEDYMVTKYKQQGFFPTFNGYIDSDRNLTFEFEVNQGNFTLSQPTFTVFPSKDPVADWAALGEQLQSYAFLSNYQNASLPTAHWPHEEMPEEYNALFTNWVEKYVTFPSH